MLEDFSNSETNPGPFAADSGQPFDLDTPIDASILPKGLGFALSALSAMRRAGARTLADLLTMTPEQLRVAGKCGRKAMDNIRAVLGEHGLDLRNETPLSREQLERLRARKRERASIADFVVHEGRLDLRAIRETGRAESLDLAGFPVRIDLADGTLWFPAANLGGDAPEDEGWVSDIGLPGMDRPVSCLGMHNGELIAAGTFSRAGVGAAQGVARWNGAGWQPLGPGLRGDIEALASFAGRLVAAGDLVLGSGRERCPAAAWDGATWSPLGSLEDDVAAGARGLLVHEGRLLATGRGFLGEDGRVLMGVMVWDGRSWRLLGPSNAPGLWCLCEHKGRLYAGGCGSRAKGLPGDVSVWNGRDWTSVGGGLECCADRAWVLPCVTTLVSHQDDLVAAGVFDGAGDVAARDIAAWDGDAWHPLGEGVRGEPRRLVSWGDQLIVGGSLRRAGGMEVGHLARWHDGRWSPFGSGTNAEVCDLLVWGDTLVAGGRFTRAGDWPACRIARWR